MPQAVAMPENSKPPLLNNGYLRTTAAAKLPQQQQQQQTVHMKNKANAEPINITSNNVPHDADADEDDYGAQDNMNTETAPTATMPLLSDASSNGGGGAAAANEANLIRQQQAKKIAIMPQQTKLPTVVFLGNDGGGSAPNAVVHTTLHNNAPQPYSSGSTTIPMQQSQSQQQQQQQQRQQQQQQSDYFMKQPILSCRLVVLAIAFTVLGAAIGALVIYFAGSYRCYPPTASASIDNKYHQHQQQHGQQKEQELDYHHHHNKHEGTTAYDNLCLTEECVRTAASLLSAMDTTADPCTNFFQYACGTWNKMHIIPEDRSSISTFEVLADQLQLILKGVLEEPIDDEDNLATIKAKTFYKSCMDLPQIRKIGEARLKEVIKSLGGWPVIEENWQPPNITIEDLVSELRGKYGEPVLVEVYVGADDKNSSVYILQIDQLTLALPSRDYYVKSSSENDRMAYHKYMTQAAILLGADPFTAAEELEQVLQFEIELANISLPEADRHDTSAIYKKLSLPELQEQVPEFDWTTFLQKTFGSQVQIRPDEELVIYAMPYLIEMGKILRHADRRVLHNYAIWRLVMSMMTHMIDEYQSERVEFRKILLGIQSERLRWSQCVEWTNKKLGMAVGALYIRDNFDQQSKDTALEMIHTIREAFNDLLAENDWMDNETRDVAKEKADSMNERIGYPDILKNSTELEKEYENLTIVPDNFMENVLNLLKWDSEKNMQLLRMPVDKEKWTTEPAVVNAFYNPNKNDIVLPVGILQPLFYSQYFPKSLNYGGIGVVIGHEITHGFDDKGRQFDKDGNMMQWWNNATVETFRKRTQCIIDQYSKYKVDEIDMYMNGRMTQGENIADNGGLKQAFRAYKKYVSRHGDEPELPGLNLSHDQLFFLNYAQIWCGSMRPEDALTKIRSSVHSPGSIRVLGPLSNSKDFARAYKCKPGSPMNPVEKCSVW